MALWKRLIGLQQPDPRDYVSQTRHGDGSRTPVELTYLGTAGFVLKGAGRTVVLDPYVTRSNLRETIKGHLLPNKELIRRYIPHADDVLVGHAHYDHILDSPDLCHQTGARLIGSRAAVMVGRAAGLPEHQLVETAGHEDIASGSWTVRGLPSRHGRVFGRIPIPGDITAPPAWPPRLRELKHGLVLNWVVDTGGLRIMHIDSADYIPQELAGVRADVVCLCAIGRQYRPNYTQEVIDLVKPRWVVPCHWDTMMTPIDATPDLIPTVDLPGFINEIRAAGAQPLPLPLLGKLEFS